MTLPFWLQWLVGFLKPLVDAELAKIQANQSAYIADIEAFATKEGGYAAGAAQVVVNALPAFLDFAKPELQSAVAAALAGLSGTVENNAPAYFAAALAFVTKEVDAVGL
jgi:hypothetical protein